METGRPFSLVISVTVILLAFVLALLLHRPSEKATTKSELIVEKRIVSSLNHKQSIKFEHSQGRGRGVGSKDFAARIDECKETKAPSKKQHQII